MRKKDTPSPAGHQGPPFKLAIMSELAKMRQQLIQPDGLRRLVAGHAELRDELKPIVAELGSDIHAADALYGIDPPDADTDQVTIGWDLLVVLASRHRLVVIRAERRTIADVEDSQDAVNRAILKLGTQPLTISSRWDIPLTNAGLISIERRRDTTPMLTVQALGGQPLPIGNEAAASRLIDAIGGRRDMVASDLLEAPEPAADEDLQL